MAFVHNMPDGVGIPWIYDLTFPVGPNCRNGPPDVQLVQVEINGVLADLTITRDDGSRIVSYLRRDGIFGPHTAEAIRGYQRAMQKEHKLIKPDGRMDPSSATGWTNDGNAQFTIVYLNKSYLKTNGQMPDEDQFPDPLKADVKNNRQVG